MDLTISSTSALTQFKGVTSRIWEGVIDGQKVSLAVLALVVHREQAEAVEQQLERSPPITEDIVPGSGDVRILL